MMSEKRFHQFGLWVIDNPNFNGISIADLVDTELMSITEVVDLLNNLHEENEKLEKGKMEALSLLGKEIDKNEQLKEKLNNFKKDETMLYHYYTLARYGGDGV